DRTTGYVVTMEGHLLRTGDGGATWRSVYGTGAAALTAIHFPAPRVGYAVGGRGTVLKFSAE
ncbi:MAG: beta propeller repeat protein, partial [Planctomycetota bacterium]